MIEKKSLIKTIIDTYSLDDVIDEDEDEDELSDNDLEDEDELETEEEVDEEDELTEDQVLAMPIDEIMAGIDQDSLLSLVNGQIGDGILQGSIDYKNGEVIIKGSYEDEQDDDVVLVMEELKQNICSFDDLLSILNKMATMFNDDLENDDDMQFFGENKDDSPEMALVKKMAARRSDD